ncbi:hypothetical protein J6590_038674 [Homalodisca vitripennis]|nr:hypothetical protein J6590_038674 [Homalodisca vitripennis]
MRLQCHCIIHYMRRDGGWAACLPPYFPYINAHSATAHIATAHSATNLVECSQRQHNRINNRIHVHSATAHSATGHSATDLAGVLTAPQLIAPQLTAPHICCGALWRYEAAPLDRYYFTTDPCELGKKHNKPHVPTMCAKSPASSTLLLVSPVEDVPVTLAWVGGQAHTAFSHPAPVDLGRQAGQQAHGHQHGADAVQKYRVHPLYLYLDVKPLVTLNGAASVPRFRLIFRVCRKSRIAVEGNEDIRMELPNP